MLPYRAFGNFDGDRIDVINFGHCWHSTSGTAWVCTARLWSDIDQLKGGSAMSYDAAIRRREVRLFMWWASTTAIASLTWSSQ
jgi:hypothetical protein